MAWLEVTSIASICGLFLAYTQATAFPVDPKPFQTISSSYASGAGIRYRELDSRVCESTPGVKSFSGYIDVAADKHVFFWLFESRRDPGKDDITILVDGGPGVDPAVALFQENGPCILGTSGIERRLDTSWNEVSTLLYLALPYGVGLSYQTKEKGYKDLASLRAVFLNSTYHEPNGRWAMADFAASDTSLSTAEAAYEAMQIFLSDVYLLDQALSSDVSINLWSRSYGGKYGPTFFRHFAKQNQKIEEKKQKGIHMKLNSLMISDGYTDSLIQGPQYPEFAIHNQYGIQAYSEYDYKWTGTMLNMSNGCLDLVNQCYYAYRAKLPYIRSICAQAGYTCNNYIEGAAYSFNNTNPYDIRAGSAGGTSNIPLVIEYLNTSPIQQEIGVNLNWSFYSADVYNAFTQAGDIAYPQATDDLVWLLENGFSVTLYYGDADYTCNWFGGEALSRQVSWKHRDEFVNAGYEPFFVNGVRHGDTRQYGNFSFTRVYRAGHQVSFFQPEAGFAVYNRTIHGFDIATGNQKVTAQYVTRGPKFSSYSES